LSAAIIPIAVGLVVLLGVYLNLRDTKKAADATIELTSAQKLMQTVTDEATSSIVDQKTKLESLLQTARNENETKANRLKAIQAINAISPKYLGTLPENINTDKARISLKTIPL
jgi:hypothetical protein